MNPSRIRKVAAALKPATLLAFHRAMKERKYRHLFSPQRRGKPGPNTPAERTGSVVTHPAALRNFTWEKHCGGLFELPVAG